MPRGRYTALMEHLHPSTDELKLYVCGGSFGTVPAQILYGLPIDAFPLGRHIVGLLVIAPFSPFYFHHGYAKTLSWASYLSVGPPAHHIPFHLVPRLMVCAVRGKFSNVEHASAFLRSTLFDKMDDSECEIFHAWCAEQGLEEGQFVREMAEDIVHSVAKSWRGFMDIVDVLHSDWGGVCPAKLDEEHAARPVLVVSSDKDDIAGPGMGEWLVSNYKNARAKVLRGGHIAAICYLDEIWEEFVKT